MTDTTSSAKPLIFKFLEYGALGAVLIVLLGAFGLLGYLFVPRWLKSFDIHDAAATENTRALGAVAAAMERVAVDVKKCTEGIASTESLRKTKR